MMKTKKMSFWTGFRGAHNVDMNVFEEFLHILYNILSQKKGLVKVLSWCVSWVFTCFLLVLLFSCVSPCIWVLPPWLPWCASPVLFSLLTDCLDVPHLCLSVFKPCHAACPLSDCLMICCSPVLCNLCSGLLCNILCFPASWESCQLYCCS